MGMPDGPKLEFKNAQDREWSVVVPVHRDRPGLERAIKSVMDQDREGLELVVVDHTADKHGLALAQDIWKAVHARLVCVDAEPAGSMAGDWNRALEYASGEWIHLLHDDDYTMSPFYKLKRLGGACYSGYRNVDQSGKINFSRREPMLPFWPAIAGGNFLQPVAVTISRQTYQQLGGYLTDHALRHCPDWEILCRIGERGVKVSYIERVLGVHVEGGDSETKDAGGALSLDVMQSCVACCEHMAANGVEPKIASGGLQTYYRHAVTQAVDAEDEGLFRFACHINRLATAMLKANNG